MTRMNQPLALRVLSRDLDHRKSREAAYTSTVAGSWQVTMPWMESER
jgi:hypothetical protein